LRLRACLEGDGDQPNIARPRVAARSTRATVLDGVLPMAMDDGRDVTHVGLHDPQDALVADDSTSPKWIT
jgi:hypothetical protein